MGFFRLDKGDHLVKMLMMLHLNTKGRTDKDTDRSFGSQGSLKDLEMAMRKREDMACVNDALVFDTKGVIHQCGVGNIPKSGIRFKRSHCKTLVETLDVGREEGIGVTDICDTGDFKLDGRRLWRVSQSFSTRPLAWGERALCMVIPSSSIARLNWVWGICWPSS